MKETAYLVINLPAAEASTPAFQAVTTVLSNPNAKTAIEIPSIVRIVLNLCLSEFFIISFRILITVKQNLLYQNALLNELFLLHSDRELP